MNKITLTTSFITAVLVATTAFAQMGPGMGGMGGQGRFVFDRDNVHGWQLMTAEEREAHRTKMLSLKTMDECKAYVAEHHTAMEARAKEKGTTLPTPRYNSCNRMQARGLLK
jgi:hypothetical protein